MTLLNKGDLAKALGVNRDFVTRMCSAGFAMPGGRATKQWALDWLKQHPEWRPTRPRPARPRGSILT